MARIPMSPELSAFVAARIARYFVESTSRFQLSEAPWVAEHAALPLIRHWFETIGLRADGEIVRWSTDDHPHRFAGVRQVEDRYDWLSALVEGSRHYPELEELLPLRKPHALDCQCVGNPQFAPGRILCPDCCGLGWR
jgi:hypothetical protein